MLSFDLDPENYLIKTTTRPSFTEMNDTTGFLTEKWKNNRKIAYEGSIDNFLQAIKENKILQNGFQVYQDIGPLSEVPLSRLKHIRDLLTKSNNGQYSLTFNGYLRILYISKDPDNPEVSWIKLLYPAVTLDSYGYSVEPAPFKVYGYWTKFGVADMLPKYYASKDSL